MSNRLHEIVKKTRFPNLSLLVSRKTASVGASKIGVTVSLIAVMLLPLFAVADDEKIARKLTHGMDVAYDLVVDLGIDTISEMAIASDVVNRLAPGLRDRIISTIDTLHEDDLRSLSLTMGRGPNVSPTVESGLDAAVGKETVSIRVTIDPTLNEAAAIIEYCFEEIAFSFLEEAIQYQHAAIDVTRFELGTAYEERGRYDDAEAAWLHSLRMLEETGRLNSAATASLVSQAISRLQLAGHVDEANALRIMREKLSR
jgi:tetratricopeptide (TPR) repeat protein